MIRVEPFTSYALENGNGKFDRPDKIFSSVEETFEDATHELIPEFYYLPEMFKNENGFDFGFPASTLPDSSGRVCSGIGDV